MPAASVLLIGYGNPGRMDDGLGPALVERLADLQVPGLSLVTDYQLQVEHAATIRQHDAVVFADAAATGPAPFQVRAVKPSSGLTFSTHSISPEDALGLSARLFGVEVPGWVLGIRGYEFGEFGERLSAPAQANLERTLDFLIAAVADASLEQLLRTTQQPTPAAKGRTETAGE
jgi:hydrogenase maturation protease